MEKTVLFLQQLLDCTSGISFVCIPYTADEIAGFLKASTKHILDSAAQQDSALSRQLFAPVLTEDSLCEHLVLGCVSFLFYGDRQAKAVYGLGPVLTQPLSPEDIRRILENYRIPKQAVSPFTQYCKNLPVLPGHSLYRMGELIVRHLTGQEKLLQIARETAPSYPEKLLLHQAIPVEENIIKMRQVEMRYEHSAAFTDAILQGNLSLALHLIGQFAPGEQTAVRNTNPLRNAQNYCIVLNTQLRHALEKTGIHPYRVDRVSNEIGLEIEQLKSVAEVSPFFQQIIRRYCRLVQEHTYPNLKPLINLAVTYIKEHLADNLTVKDTAKDLTVNANYLSTLFHKETGMTFIDFVNQERTRQAAALLKHTNLQIQQIASIVGYNNTSYFAKQFLRFQGTNPSYYRKGSV